MANARRELAQQAPGLRLVAFGESELAEDLCEAGGALHARTARRAASRTAHDVMRLGYSGGTTGKPKALASMQRTASRDALDHAGGLGVASPPRFLSCTPLSHAGAAMFLPTLLKRRDDARPARASSRRR